MRKKALEEAAEQFKPVVERLSSSLKTKPKSASNDTFGGFTMFGNRWGELSPQLIRMLKQAGQAVPESKPTLEINPEHPLVKKTRNSAQFDDLANVIFDQAVIAEGGLQKILRLMSNVSVYVAINNVTISDLT